MPRGHEHFPLRAAREDRAGWHGGGLPGPDGRRRGVLQDRGRQAPAAQPHRRPGGDQEFRRGGAAHLHPRPPEHRPGSQLREGRRSVPADHGVRTGTLGIPVAEGVSLAGRRDPHRAGGLHRLRGRRRPALRPHPARRSGPPGAHRAPRRHPPERADLQRRPGQGDRLRYRQGGLAEQAHPQGFRQGEALLPLSGTGAWRGRGSALDG